MNKIFIILLGTFFPLFIFGGEADLQDFIAKGDSAYIADQYEEAIRNYELVFEQGYSSTQLYYNLGNAYLQLNKLPEAILNYERAKRLSPRDKDLNDNLNMAYSMIQDRIETVPDIFYVKWWKSLRNAFSLQSWTYACIGLFGLLICCAGFFILSQIIVVRRISFWAGILFFLLLLPSFFMAYSRYNIQTKKLEAIVFAPTITAKHNPGEKSADVFVIHEGTKVFILEELEDSVWCNVRIANGSTGWIPVEGLEKI